MSTHVVDKEQVVAEARRILAEADRYESETAAKRRKQPHARLWDGDWREGGAVQGAISIEVKWVINNTGTATVVLPAAHHLARWALSPSMRKRRNLHLTVDKDGSRWGGRCRDAKLVKDDEGNKVCVLEFLSDYEELKYINVWANPFLPAAFQFPKVFVLGGPAKYMLKLALFVNILRLESNLWHLPDDPLNPANWVNGATMWNWPKVVQPGSALLDSSQWAIVSSRFKSWHNMAEPILKDAGLMVTTRRWLDGDESPWPGAIMRNGQLIFDIVDKSGVFDGTALGGTVLGGLVRTVTSHADNFVDEIVTSVANPVVPAEYTVSKLFGTHPKMPWVVWRDGAVTGVETMEYTWSPSTVVQVNGGGQSMPGVNEGIEMAVKLVGDLFSVITFGLVGIGSIANTALKPLYTDVILAFYSLKSIIRAQQSGWDHYYETFAENGGTGYTLSAVMALREVFWDTRTRESLTADIADGAPYLLGEHGQGHCFLGDRVGVAPTELGGRVVVEQITELTYTADREQSRWSLQLGDREEAESPIEKSLRQIQGIFGTLHDLGVM